MHFGRLGLLRGNSSQNLKLVIYRPFVIETRVCASVVQSYHVREQMCCLFPVLWSLPSHT